VTAGEWAQEILALSRRWFLLLHRDRLQLAFSLAQPPLWFLFLGKGVGHAVDAQVVGTADYAAFLLGGIVAVAAASYSMSGAMPILWDKETGYLDKLMAMPIARSSVIVSRFLFQFALGTAQVVLVLLIGVALGVRIAGGATGALGMLAIAGLLSMAATAAFMALAYRVPSHGTFFAVAGFVTVPFVFLSNAFVPLSAMPPALAALAWVNPMTYAVDALRRLVLEGWSLNVLRSVGVLAAFAAGSLALGTREFRRHTSQGGH